MVAERWVNGSGTARKIRERWVNDGGTARKIKERWVNDGGTARCIYRSEIVNPNLTLVTISSWRSNQDTSAILAVRPDGSVYAYDLSILTSVTPWLIPPGNEASYECMATRISGQTVSGTVGSWLSLGQEQFWSLTTTGVGVRLANIRIDIRLIGTTTILGSFTVSFMVERG